jgi:transporter family-2 protein
MSNTVFFILLALAAGAMMPTQAAINNKLAVAVESPILAAFVSFVVGTAALFVYLMISGSPLGNLASVKDAAPISWIGGLLGAFFVAAAVTLVPRLGVAMTFSLIIAGQMLVTLVIDHFRPARRSGDQGQFGPCRRNFPHYRGGCIDPKVLVRSYRRTRMQF